MAVTSAHTTSVTGPGITSSDLITSVTISRSGAEILDASHLGLSAGSDALNYEGPFGGTNEVSVSYIGDSIPDSGDEGAVAVTGAISISFTNAVVTSSSVTGSVGELITADVTYKEIES